MLVSGIAAQSASVNPTRTWAMVPPYFRMSATAPATRDSSSCGSGCPGSEARIPGW